MEGWLKGNVCQSAAKDVREEILGRKIEEDGKDRSEWTRRNPATGLPGESIPIELAFGPQTQSKEDILLIRAMADKRVDHFIQVLGGIAVQETVEEAKALGVNNKELIDLLLNALQWQMPDGWLDDPLHMCYQLDPETRLIHRSTEKKTYDDNGQPRKFEKQNVWYDSDQYTSEDYAAFIERAAKRKGSFMPNNLERIRKLEQELEAAKKAEIENLLNQRSEIDKQLAALGYPKLHTSGKKKPEKDEENKPCSICQFMTEPSHDGRNHRMQGKHKKPFTDEELKTTGYKRLGVDA